MKEAVKQLLKDYCEADVKEKEAKKIKEKTKKELEKLKLKFGLHMLTGFSLEKAEVFKGEVNNHGIFWAIGKEKYIEIAKPTMKDLEALLTPEQLGEHITYSDKPTGFKYSVKRR